jgi:hypothetical protein
MKTACGAGFAVEIGEAVERFVDALWNDGGWRSRKLTNYLPYRVRAYGMRLWAC